jgi:hypothetical protein
VPFTDAAVGSTFLLSKVMVQLQLQETSEPENKSGRASRAHVFEMSYAPVIAVLIAVVLGLGFNSAYGHRLADQTQGVAQEQKGARYTNRMNVIGQLRQRQTVPSNALIVLSVNPTDSRAVWLKSIKDQGESIAIEGMAITPNAVSEIISNLKSTGCFRNIEIKETYQDDSKNKTHAFEFQLTCEFETNRS